MGQVSNSLHCRQRKVQPKKEIRGKKVALDKPMQQRKNTHKHQQTKPISMQLLMFHK